jgi:hypothetical protein
VIAMISVNIVIEFVTARLINPRRKMIREHSSVGFLP